MQTAVKTLSNASRRPSSSSISFHLRSNSIARRRVLTSWFATAAEEVPSSLERTCWVSLFQDTLELIELAVRSAPTGFRRVAPAFVGVGRIMGVTIALRCSNDTLARRALRVV